MTELTLKDREKIEASKYDLRIKRESNIFQVMLVLEQFAIFSSVPFGAFFKFIIAEKPAVIIEVNAFNHQPLAFKLAQDFGVKLIHGFFGQSAWRH